MLYLTTLVNLDTQGVTQGAQLQPLCCRHRQGSAELRPEAFYVMQEVDAYGLSHRGRFAIVGRPLYDFPSLLKWPLQFRMIPPPGVKTGCVLGFTDQVLEAQKIARSFGPGCPNLIRESDGSGLFQRVGHTEFC